MVYDSNDIAKVAEKALRSSQMGSVGLYVLADSGAFEDGVILNMPLAFVSAYETLGASIDPVLAELRRTGVPVSTRTVLGDRWTQCQLYQRVSGRFGLAGFAALPLYRSDTLFGILYLGALDQTQVTRLEKWNLSDLTVFGMRAGTELLSLPGRHPALTPRQDAVARLAAEGMTNRQIAEELATGEAAVRKHMKALHQIFGVTTRTAMARRYLEGGHGSPFGDFSPGRHG